jgi:hypothetical protein
MSVTVGSLPSPSTLGGGAIPSFSGWLVYLQFTWGSAPPPLSGEACCSSAAVGSFPLSKLSVGDFTPAFFFRLVYLEFTWGSAPPPYSGTQGALPSLLCVLFFSCLFIISFFLLGGGQSVQQDMLIFLRGGCGRTACHLLLTCGSVKQVRSQYLVAWEPSWFLHIP